MNLFYCPKCGRESIEDKSVPSKDFVCHNMRDGYGRPVTHYKCECGNYFAGTILVTGKENDLDFIKYCRHVIDGYNEGGMFYDEEQAKSIIKSYEEQAELTKYYESTKQKRSMLFYIDRLKIKDAYYEWLKENQYIKDCPENFIAFMAGEGLLKDRTECDFYDKYQRRHAWK